MELEEILKKFSKEINGFKTTTILSDCDFGLEEIQKDKDLLTPPPDIYLKGDSLVMLTLTQGRLYEYNNKPQKALDNYLAVLRYLKHLAQQKEFVFYTIIVELIVTGQVYYPLADLIKNDYLSQENYQNLIDALGSVNFKADYLIKGIDEENKMTKNTWQKEINLLEDTYTGKETDAVKIVSSDINRQLDLILNEYRNYLVEAVKENDTSIYQKKITEFRQELEKEINVKGKLSKIFKIIMNWNKPKVSSVPLLVE